MSSLPGSCLTRTRVVARREAALFRGGGAAGGGIAIGCDRRRRAGNGCLLAETAGLSELIRLDAAALVPAAATGSMRGEALREKEEKRERVEK